MRYNFTQNGGIVGRKIRNFQCKVEFLGVIREHFKARKATGSEFDKTLVLCLVHYSKFWRLFSEFLVRSLTCNKIFIDICSFRISKNNFTLEIMASVDFPQRTDQNSLQPLDTMSHDSDAFVQQWRNLPSFI